jgi:hypothetical protein
VIQVDENIHNETMSRRVACGTSLLIVTRLSAGTGNDYGDELEKIGALSPVYRDYLAEGLEELDNGPNDTELIKRW